ncbi:hypothetical protein EDB86DRAFT_3092495 [Lactarius hatsudake]|nr:hypothetical protein EDB86DRAFT_3092495 [Lactarius hatsudake]
METRIRCAVSEWASLLLLIIDPSRRVMGQASFLILVAGMLSPPGDPFVTSTEREIIILLSVLMAWGWASLGIKLASLARSHTVYTATLDDILSGKYIEATPSIINAIFLFFGSSFFLYIKAQQGPDRLSSRNRYFIDDFSVISLRVLQIWTSSRDPIGISLGLGNSVIRAHIPYFRCRTYTTGLRGVIGPLGSSFRQHLALLGISASSPDFSPKAVRASASKAENGLAPLAASARLLGRDISWGRFSGKDLDGMREKVQRLVMRAHGMNVYFALIDPTRERFPVTPVPSHPGSPTAGTPNVSRPSSPARTEESASASPAVHHSTVGCSQADVEQHRGRQAQRRHPRFDVDSAMHSAKSYLHGSLFRSHRHHRHSYVSLLSGFHHHDNLREHVVGVFESQKYLDLESHHFSHPLKGLEEVDSWLGTSRHRRWMFWWGGDKRTRVQQERIDALSRACDELARTLEAFRASIRHLVLEPYREAFSDKHEGCMTGGDIPPHRFLFHAYTYQSSYGLSLMRSPQLDIWDHNVNLEREDDENPNIIQGKEGLCMDIGVAQRRDPDALPPRNSFEAFMSVLYHAFRGLSRGNQLFAIKAGVLTALLSIPAFVRSSAKLAYGEKFSWAIFMGQLTLARFRGDTTFGLVARIVIPNMIFFTTTALVIGYSWQNTHSNGGGFLYYGINLAWRRFVLVGAGVSAAFIFSFLPPSTTLRGYQRQSLATTASEIGSVYCSVVSYASSSHAENPQHVIQSLVAIRLKLKRSIVLRANIIYEAIFLAWAMASGEVSKDFGNSAVGVMYPLDERSFAHGFPQAKLRTFSRI